MNKKWILFLVVFCYSIPLNLFAQNGKVPPFKILQTSGKVFNATNLPLGKPIVIIYFSPECDHCDVLTKDLIKQQETFKKASVVMVTYLPLEQVKKFEQKHGLARLSNFYVGTEGNSFFLRKYYKLNSMPFLALYNKNGDIIKSYLDEKGLPDLAKRLSLLK